MVSWPIQALRAKIDPNDFRGLRGLSVLYRWGNSRMGLGYLLESDTAEYCGFERDTDSEDARRPARPRRSTRGALGACASPVGWPARDAYHSLASILGSGIRDDGLPSGFTLPQRITVHHLAMDNITLYHFTAAERLLGIGQYGLTVGDVPTDLTKNRGVIGVWLTASPVAEGHGLEGSSGDKKRYRLSIELPIDVPTLHRWTDWSSRYVTPETLRSLHSTAHGWESWYIFLGVVKPDAITECLDTRTGVLVPNWREVSTPTSQDNAVPPWRRHAWQKRMLKAVQKAAANRSKASAARFP